MRRTRLRPPLLAVALVAVLATSTGCLSARGAGGSATDTVNAGIGSDPSTFDPALGAASDDYFVDRLFYDTLTRRDSDGLTGGLATGWKAVSASEFVFTIRSGATCSDGTPITPTVVADSLTRFADPETASPGRTLAMGGGKATVTADDDADTVTVELTEDWADLPTGLSLPQTGIVCPAGLADPEGLAAGKVKGAFSGPYTLARATPAVRYELTLRQDYDAWPRFSEPLKGTAPATLVLTPFGDQSTKATQLLSGALDVASFSDESMVRFENNDSFSLDLVNQIGAYLLFNERKGSVFAGRPGLRRAVAQAVDPDAFTQVATNGRGQVLRSVGSAELPCVNTDTSLLPGYDPDAAGKVLDGVTIRLVGTNQLEQGNEYIAEVLRNAGADVKLRNLDNAQWSEVTSTGGNGWDVTIQGDLNVVGTLPSSLLRVMGPATEDGGRNKTGAVDEKGYAALQQAMSTTAADKRCQALQRAQESFLERVDAAPLAGLAEAAVSADSVSIRTLGDYIDPATIRITG
ncbi:ABC transporter substrate-binding protein [Streptomyces sp. HC44]|uniref:ABC transporter substrate-binding protein n=1 Tax=Streptomyces scabichelini TaxID=2711217 RepID=A0A6G4UYR1_9ACTN|nr:ABC transporter substrate-binding protein [Streptomyces scabichelini]NGO06773.1 ABC transporter substrate-binding protein [Streptomyces scabichelini]